MDRPTVAHVHRTYLNLTENWIHAQVRFLRDVRSIFLAKRPANLEQFPWPSVHLLWHQAKAKRQWNRAVRPLLGYYPYYRQVAREEDVRIIHAHSGAIGRESLGLAGRIRRPLVTSFYGYELSVHREGERGLRRDYRSLFARGDLFVAEGPFARERIIRLGCPPAKVVVHRIGIDPAEIPFVPRAPRAGEPFRVLMAARFDEKKGLPYGLEAFARIARAHPTLRLTLVGDAGPIPEQQSVKAELHEIVRSHGVGDRVVFTGFLPTSELRRISLEHHLLLHPSVHARNGDSEGGHPVVLTEAAASGMPIVATRHCDIPEVVVDGETGWLCQERNVEELVGALESALAREADLPEMGRRARALVEDKYDGRANTLDPVYAAVLAAST